MFLVVNFFSKSCLIFLFLFLGGCKTQTLQTVLNESGVLNQDPTKQEMGLGLKEALSVSIEKGAKKLALKDGYFKDQAVKILLPQEVKGVESTLRKMGLGALTDDLAVRLNRAAEDAAMKSVPIFKKAILSMSFQDVLGVLTGENNAATSYLQKTTTSDLTKAFSPQISQSLNKVGAAKLWKEIFTRYNSVPFVKKVNTDLVGYTTSMALKGLFVKVADKEKGIRGQVSERTSPLLKKVFSYADKYRK